MNVTSNNPMDFIAMAKASGTNLEELIVSDEFIEWFREHLSENNINVTFTKKDGTSRTMHCTRDISKIPIELHPVGSTTGTKSTGDAVQVFDLGINEWRSFKTSTLTHIEWL
jgi:hypothetical protein